MKNLDTELIKTVRVILVAVDMPQAVAAAGMGMSSSAFNRKMMGRSKWMVQDLYAMALMWKCEPKDLLMGPTAALRAIVGTAPAQRTDSALVA